MTNIQAYFFSPTGTTEKVVRRIAAGLSVALNDDDIVQVTDFTPLSARKVEKEEPQTESSILIKDSTLVLGVPVYAGRVPNILLKYLSQFKAENSDVVIVAVYGNRAFDDALVELKALVAECGFKVIGAGAFVGEHAFSDKIAIGRPDAEDLMAIDTFVNAIVTRIKEREIAHDHPLDDSQIEVPGELPFRPYYRPLDYEGNPFDFKAIKPETLDKCIHCGICAKHCPVQCISHEDHKTIISRCIKCCSCVKRCPVDAKIFEDKNYIKHRRELEEQCQERREPVFFV